MSAGEHARGLVGSRQKGYPEFKMGAEHRAKIANSNILNNLIGHVEGTREMSATQVHAGIALLKKVMPDLTYSETHGEATLTIARVVHEIVDPQQQINPPPSTLRIVNTS